MEHPPKSGPERTRELERSLLELNTRITSRALRSALGGQAQTTAGDFYAVF